MNNSSPEDVGFSSDHLARVNDLSQRYVESGKLAGVVTMLARRGQTFHFERSGVMDTESGRPIDLDSIFRIRSMTKPITSVAVMMLHEEGLFNLDDPVSQFIPEFAGLKVYVGMGQTGIQLVEPERPMTVRHLLTHTSGLSSGLFEDSPVESMYREASLRDPDSNLKQMVEKLSTLPLIYQPGAGWRYGVATDVLGYLVQVWSGQPFDRFLKERIFEPLGMEDTGFYVPEEKLERLASVYGPSDGAGIARIDTPEVSRYKRAHSFFSGGGGLVSTASDYMRFCQMLIDGGESPGVRLLGPKTVELMTMNHLPAELIPYHVNEDLSDFTRGCGFGLGFKVVMDVAQQGVPGSAGTYSWGGAASTFFWIDPCEELVAILMTQFMPMGHYPIRTEFQVATYQAMVA